LEKTSELATLNFPQTQVTAKGEPQGGFKQQMSHSR
jgi:hypothetical protein